MKAYISRNRDGTVASGWLLREHVSIHSTLCRLRRTQPNDASVEDAAIEAVIRGAAPGDLVGGQPATSVASMVDDETCPAINTDNGRKAD